MRNMDRIAKDELKELIEGLIFNDLATEGAEDCIDFTDSSCAADLDEALDELGWERGEMQTNGWELDFWIDYTKKDSNFRLMVSGSGYFATTRLEKIEEE